MRPWEKSTIPRVSPAASVVSELNTAARTIPLCNVLLYANLCQFICTYLHTNICVLVCVRTYAERVGQ